MHTLVIDTSFGSTIALVGHEPITETDSRTHVERLQTDIDRACREAGVAPHDLGRIVVGVGPAPFTGLRAGIVTAQALAFATGAALFAQDDLTPSVALMQAAHRHDPRFADRLPYERIAPPEPDTIAVTLAVNDARRRQLYFALYADMGDGDGSFTTLIDMDIDYPTHIAQRVTQALDELCHAHPGEVPALDIVGHGATRYADAWEPLAAELVTDATALDMGAEGAALFAQVAQAGAPADGVDPAGIQPLYLRRPDVSVPNPLKHVLGHAPAKGSDA
ncbi:MAG: tRNA (adenosine(37)-N6)-threonylcarbamoyltransferase complex dimerization subunit type 1 TsaB [Bifidobacterium sp.]|nr:tRNA (adenosine(37)-N6)-threonylcarbamoyltransferase complex dimerization subunit type 1 TsaB [Bifidobacterium sp.]